MKMEILESMIMLASLHTVRREKAMNEKKRYRQLSLPENLQGWYKPEFDASGWQSGQAPIGKGTWKFRDYPEAKMQSKW